MIVGKRRLRRDASKRERPHDLLPGSRIGKTFAPAARVLNPARRHPLTAREVRTQRRISKTHALPVALRTRIRARSELIPHGVDQHHDSFRFNAVRSSRPHTSFLVPRVSLGNAEAHGETNDLHHRVFRLTAW